MESPHVSGHLVFALALMISHHVSLLSVVNHAWTAGLHTLLTNAHCYPASSQHPPLPFVPRSAQSITSRDPSVTIASSMHSALHAHPLSSRGKWTTSKLELFPNFYFSSPPCDESVLQSRHLDRIYPK